MLRRLTTAFALVTLAAFAGCADGAEEEFETTETELITEPGTETVEIEVPTEDTLMVERTLEAEVEVDVDTTEVD